MLWTKMFCDPVQLGILTLSLFHYLLPLPTCNALQSYTLLLDRREAAHTRLEKNTLLFILIYPRCYILSLRSASLKR